MPFTIKGATNYVNRIGGLAIDPQAHVLSPEVDVRLQLPDPSAPHPISWSVRQGVRLIVSDP